MSLVRMAGLIVLPLVATTLQAEARCLPVEPADRQPQKSSPPRRVADAPERRQHTLVLTPNTQVWHDTATPSLDESATGGPAAFQDLSQGPPPAWRPVGRTLNGGAQVPRAESTRPWLMARYPHAPPA